MLALRQDATTYAHHRRHHQQPQHTHHQPSATYFDPTALATTTPSPSQLNAFNLFQLQQQQGLTESHLLDAAGPLPTTTIPQMPAYDFSSPAIRIEHPTPSSQSSYVPVTSDSLANPAFAAAGILPQVWEHQYAGRKNAAHRRGPSSSSLASNPASPYARNQFINTKSEHSPIGTYLGADSRRGFSNNLPTPTDTPTSDSFAGAGLHPSSNNQNFDNMSAHYAMRDMLGAQEVVPDTPDFSHSGRHSVSSYNEHEAPTTPHTVSGDEFDYRPNNQGESISTVSDWPSPYLLFDDNSDTLKPQHQPVIVPKFDRTLSDMLQDELFPPVSATSAPKQQRQSSTSSHLSPLAASRNLQERLLAANQARAASPNSRDASPYRLSSAYAHATPKLGNRFAVASQLDGQQKSQTNVGTLGGQTAQQSQPEAPKSVSPKDTILEYREPEEDSKLALFPEEEVNAYGPRLGGGNVTQQLNANATASGNYNSASSAQNYSGMASNNDAGWAVPHHPSSSSYAHNPSMNLQPHASYGAFMPQSMQMTANLQGLPFGTQTYRNVNGMAAHEDSPEFPAHLTSMESSMSEAPTSSQNSAIQHDVPQQKPGSSLADTGTYSCTYHGCSHRFATPQKLQKHKREAHRSVGTSTTPGVGSGMTSAQLLARNSQSGPHRCDRINPTTGKSCNTMFSRPYDLTRHEDTIHNIRKTKVRCALCVEEKTFSRNDALTRHMRVVHPEVDFPGKHRRRGTGSE